MSPELAAVVVADAPGSWRSAGFSVVGDDVHIGALTVRTDGAGPSIAWSLRSGHALPADVDGIAVIDAEPTVPEAHGAHQNGVTAVDHVVVRSPDLDRTTEAFGAIGLELRRTRDATIGDHAVQQRFFWLGAVVLELVGSPRATGDGPASIWGLALVADDLDASCGWLGPDRCSAPRPAVQRGRRIATVRTDALGISPTIALMTPHVRAGS